MKTLGHIKYRQGHSLSTAPNCGVIVRIILAGGSGGLNHPSTGSTRKYCINEFKYPFVNQYACNKKLDWKFAELIIDRMKNANRTERFLFTEPMAVKNGESIKPKQTVKLHIKILPTFPIPETFFMNNCKGSEKKRPELENCSWSNVSTPSTMSVKIIRKKNIWKLKWLKLYNEFLSEYKIELRAIVRRAKKNFGIVESTFIYNLFGDEIGFKKNLRLLKHYLKENEIKIIKVSRTKPIKTTLEKNGIASDLVRQYLREKGNVNLLSRVEEVKIVKSIEWNEKKVIRALSKANVEPNFIIKLGRGVLEGIKVIDRVIDINEDIDDESKKQKIRHHFLIRKQRLLRQFDKTWDEDSPECQNLVEKMTNYQCHLANPYEMHKNLEIDNSDSIDAKTIKNVVGRKKREREGKANIIIYRFSLLKGVGATVRKVLPLLHYLIQEGYRFQKSLYVFDSVVGGIDRRAFREAKINNLRTPFTNSPVKIDRRTFFLEKINITTFFRRQQILFGMGNKYDGDGFPFTLYSYTKISRCGKVLRLFIEYKIIIFKDGERDVAD